jgi:hypothetical protein
MPGPEGYPNPNFLRAPLELPTPFNVGHAYLLADGAFSVKVTIAGSRVARLRYKMTGAGVFSFAFCRCDAALTPYGADNPANSAAVVADVEDSCDLTLQGEAYLKITFTPSADGAITFCDFYQL